MVWNAIQPEWITLDKLLTGIYYEEINIDIIYFKGIGIGSLMLLTIMRL